MDMILLTFVCQITGTTPEIRAQLRKYGHNMNWNEACLLAKLEEAEWLSGNSPTGARPNESSEAMCDTSFFQVFCARSGSACVTRVDPRVVEHFLENT